MTTNNVNINEFVFNQDILDQRIAQAVYQFNRSYAAVDRLSKPASLLIPELQELFVSGRKLSEHFPANSMGALTVFLVKENIDELLEEVIKSTTDSYMAELESLKEKNKLLLAEQLYQDKKRKEQKAIDAKEQKDRDAALADAEQYFANLSSAKEAI